MPESEQTLLVNSTGKIIGYYAGNYVSSGNLKGGNPLYLSLQKIYDGLCTIGQGILITDIENIRDITIKLKIERKKINLFR